MSLRGRNWHKKETPHYPVQIILIHLIPNSVTMVRLEFVAMESGFLGSIRGANRRSVVWGCALGVVVSALGCSGSDAISRGGVQDPRALDGSRARDAMTDS